jgi:DNA-binding winged helix-turn-helix (wHTH) protein
VTRFQFADFELDAASGRLTHAGTPVAVPARHLDVLVALLMRAGEVVSKDALVEAAWRDVAVTDNSLEQAISSLRRALATARPEAGPLNTARPEGGPSNAADPGALIETVPRQGYRFAGAVRRVTPRATDAALDALIAPHRAFVEGRAALESLSVDRVIDAARAFDTMLAASPENAAAHVGMATANAMRFEMTRADPTPDLDALAAAGNHAREACRLDPAYGEAWATLGFVLDRTGAHVDAMAALSRAVSLEQDNWRHHLRLAAVSWGEARLRAARRTLALLPGCPLAHWLAATVHVARQAIDRAERELVAGCAAFAAAGPDARFSGVALEYLLGLIHLSRGDATAAREHFDRELAAEHGGHLYTRECCANVWYAIGGLRWRDGDRAGASEAFAEALRRVEGHGLASIGLMMSASPSSGSQDPGPRRGDPGPRTATDRGRLGGVDVAMARAVALACAGQRAEAAAVVDAALAVAPAGNHGWILPVEPLLQVGGPEWEPVLARLRSRAA